MSLKRIYKDSAEEGQTFIQKFLCYLCGICNIHYLILNLEERLKTGATNSEKKLNFEDK